MLSCEDFLDGSDDNASYWVQTQDATECAAAAADAKKYWDAVREGMRPVGPAPKAPNLTPEQLAAIGKQLRSGPGGGPVAPPPGDINPGDISKGIVEGAR